jgi:hypothetical protein
MNERIDDDVRTRFALVVFMSVQLERVAMGAVVSGPEKEVR